MTPAPHPPGDDPPRPRRGPDRRAWVGLGVVVGVALAAVLALRLEGGRTTAAPAARECGPARAVIAAGGMLPGGCRLEALSTGAGVTLADYAAGKPVVVNFWASWCGACIQEMPQLQAVYRQAAGSVQFLGLDLLGVDGESRSDAQAFARQRAVSYPLAYDDGGLLYSRISLRVLPPTTAFVRADGTLAGIHIGQLDAPALRGLIGEYLGITVAP